MYYDVMNESFELPLVFQFKSVGCWPFTAVMEVEFHYLKEQLLAALLSGYHSVKQQYHKVESLRITAVKI